MKKISKRAIIFAVIFGVISGFVDFALSTFFNVEKSVVFIIITVAFVVLGTQLGIWTEKKNK